jgi:hypothetical protein
MKYDIIFTASTFKSNDNAIRTINSVRHIPGRHLYILTGPFLEDMQAIAAGIERGTETILWQSDNPNLYFCRDWGWLSAKMLGLEAYWHCTGDDDLEFTDASAEIVYQLLRARRIGASVIGFNSSCNFYGGAISKMVDNFRTDAPWINGDCMFAAWEDNLEYGLPDCLPNHNVPFFTEVEYQHRLRALSGRPLLVAVDKTYYVHHSRTQPEISAIRDLDVVGRITAGSDFWKAKYGVEPGDWNVPYIHERLFNLTKDMREEMQRHLILDGIWTDWQAAIKYAEPFTKLVYDGVRW